MSTSATRRILHITTDNLSDLKEKQFGNALSANAYYHTPLKGSDWGAKDIYGDVQTFAALDSSVVFEKLYLGGDGGDIITIATRASDDETSDGTTRASNSINIGRGAGIDMVDDNGHINIGDFAGRESQGGSIGYGKVINLGYYSGNQSDGQANINIGNITSYELIGNRNLNIGDSTSYGLSGDHNNIIGSYAGSSMSGSYNNAYGHDSLTQSIGNYNVAVGASTGYQSTGNHMTMVGDNAGSYMVSVSGATAIGYGAGVSTSGALNSFIGCNTGLSLSGDFNIVMGNGAGYGARGSKNVFIGTEMASSLSGDSNVAIGHGTLYVLDNSNNFDIYSNIAIGDYAAENPQVGFNNAIAIGDHTLASAGPITNAIAIGKGALHNTGNAGDTVAIGTSAGANSHSPGSVFIGKDAGKGETNSARFAIAGVGGTILSGDFITKEVIVDHMKFPQTSEPTIISSAHAYIFASAAGLSTELFVEDGDSNITRISPHNDDGEWEYFSRNKTTGKTIRINMEKFIRKMEEITGEHFIEDL